MHVEGPWGGCRLERVWQIPSPALSRSLHVSARPWVQILRGGLPSQVGKGRKEPRLPLPSGCGQHLWGAGSSREVLIIAPSNSWGSSSNARRETEALSGEGTFPRCLSCLGNLRLGSISEPGGAAQWFSTDP